MECSDDEKTVCEWAFCEPTMAQVPAKRPRGRPAAVQVNEDKFRHFVAKGMTRSSATSSTSKLEKEVGPHQETTAAARCQAVTSTVTSEACPHNNVTGGWKMMGRGPGGGTRRPPVLYSLASIPTLTLILTLIPTLTLTLTLNPDPHSHRQRMLDQGSEKVFAIKAHIDHSYGEANPATLRRGSAIMISGPGSLLSS